MPSYHSSGEPRAQHAQHVRPAVLGFVYDGFDFGIHFQYFEGLPAVLKGEPYFGRFIGSKVGNYYRFWRFKKHIIDDLGRQLLDRVCEASDGVVYTSWEEFQDSIQTARENTIAAAFTFDVKEVVYTLNDDSVALVGSYHPGVIAVCKSMGGRYLVPMKAWKIPCASAVALKNNLMTDLLLLDGQIDVIDGVCSIVDDAFVKQGNDVGIALSNNAQLETGLAEAEEGDTEVFLAITTPLGRSDLSAAQIDEHIRLYDLYDYQQTGVRHLLSSTSALLADDMGLGKTRQAIVAAHVLSGANQVLIICPASLIINWTREIRMVVPDASIAEKSYDAKCHWIVTNYESVESMVVHAKQFFVMILDEAHFLKEPTTKRTRVVFDVAAQVPYRFILTGTPILNRECEIHTLLRLSGHPVGNIPLKEFEAQFAGDPAFRSLLNQRISEWMLRRKKDIVLKSLKGKQHQVAYISPTKKQQSEYSTLANNSTLSALPKLTKLRNLLEVIKMDAVVGLVKSMAAQDKVLIFCEFVESVSLLAARLREINVNVVTMIGDDSNKKRQRAVDQFQDNPDVSVFVGTTGAAGIGYNLTAANYVIFASLPWTDGQKTQAEDRAYRNGQKRLVVIKIPFMENTIDADLWALLLHKKGIADEILDPAEAQKNAMATLALALDKNCERLPRSRKTGVALA